MDLGVIVRNIDAVIAAIDATPANAGQLKQGVMQEFLAGRVRPL